MAMEAGLYRRTGALEKLERRTTKYQFDLERDVAWASDDNDHYFPAALLGQFGIDVARLASKGEALGALEWALALGACRNFVDLEEIVVRFASEERAHFEDARSLELLDTEEQKHIVLFQRLAERLVAKRPGWVPAFEEAYRPTAAVNSKQRSVHFQKELYPDLAAQHFVFWIAIIFFEEFTIYIDEELSADPSLNALWRSAHAAHRREEVQHVATDIAYVDALTLGEEDRMFWSDVLVTGILRDLRYMTSLDAANRFVAKMFPEVGEVVPETPPHEAPFLKEICARPAFKRTQAYLPTLQLLV